MNPTALQPLRRILLALALGGSAAIALGSPGAHGPNGEHLDAPQAAGAATSSAPRLDAQSELFELVARLDGGELSILVDEFASNEPLLGAQLEVESGGLKAQAKFHADLGDYAVDDAALLKLLATPGEHALVFTILAGERSDLLDGVLRVGAGHGHDGDDAAAGSRPSWRKVAGAGAGLALLLAAGWSWRRRGAARLARTTQGEQA